MEMLHRKGIVNDPMCRLCLSDVESVEHVFRLCPFVRGIWECVGRRFGLDTSGVQPFDAWLHLHGTKHTQLSTSFYWNSFFPLLLWGIWKARNELVFRAKHPTAEHIIAYAEKLTKEAGKVFFMDKRLNDASGRLISWKHPPIGSFLLNSDGSRRHTDNQASAGGLIRDASGNWMVGFMVNIGVTGSLEAELWGVRQGLLLAKERGYAPLIVELDAAVVVHFLQHDMINSHPCYTLVRDCLDLIKGNWIVEIRHIFREGNRCADCLVLLAHEAEQGVTVCNKPPQQLLPLLEDDRIGIGTIRP